MPRVAVTDAASPAEEAPETPAKKHHHHKHQHHHKSPEAAPPGSVEVARESPEAAARKVVEHGGKRFHGRAAHSAHPEDRHAGGKRLKDARAAPAPVAEKIRRATRTLRATFGFGRRRSSAYETVTVKEADRAIGFDKDANFAAVEGHERKKMAGAHKQREKRHPETRPENRQIKVLHKAEDLLQLQLKQKEKEWYETNRPEVAKQMEADARPKANKLTFKRTMNLRNPSVVWDKSLSVVMGKEFALNKAFRKYARDHPQTGRRVLFRKEATKFFLKLNGVSPPADALDYIDVDDGLYEDDGTLKYKVEDYNSYMKHRVEIRARHKAWIDTYKHYADDGVAFHPSEVKRMVVELCHHAFDEDAYDHARRACQCDTPAKDLKVHDAHKFVLAYDKKMRANQRDHELKVHNSCAHVLCRCLTCRPI